MSESEMQRILRGRSVEVVAAELEMVAWIQALSTWDTFFTNTFAWPASEDSCRRIWERWIRSFQPGVPVFYGIDPNPSGDGGHHVHALLASSGGIYRSQAWDSWYQRYGVNRVEPIAAIGGVSGYVAKYPIGGARWWNVLNCRQQAFSGGQRTAPVSWPGGPSARRMRRRSTSDRVPKDEARPENQASERVMRMLA
jgi:hypothetical protein